MPNSSEHEPEPLRESARSGDRLRVALDTIPALAWSSRPDGSSENAKSTLARSYQGVQRGSTGLGLEDCHSSGRSTGIREALARTSGCRGAGHEAPMRRLDGEYRWFLFRCEPLRDRSGNVREETAFNQRSLKRSTDRE
jgi:PAS domain-containing protein